MSILFLRMMVASYISFRQILVPILRGTYSGKQHPLLSVLWTQTQSETLGLLLLALCQPLGKA